VEHRVDISSSTATTAILYHVLHIENVGIINFFFVLVIIVFIRRVRVVELLIEIEEVLLWYILGVVLGSGGLDVGCHWPIFNELFHSIFKLLFGLIVIIERLGRRDKERLRSPTCWRLKLSLSHTYFNTLYFIVIYKHSIIFLGELLHEGIPVFIILQAWCNLLYCRIVTFIMIVMLLWACMLSEHTFSLVFERVLCLMIHTVV
jgi:hypothetical protein